VVDGFLRNLRDLPGALTAGGLASAAVAGLWNISPMLITLSAARQANLPDAAAVSWLLSVSVVGGLLSIILSLRYRLPIVGAYTIPGVALVGAALSHLPFDQVVGTYWIAGAAVLLLGATGLIDRVTGRLPMPVMMGMVAGVLFPFVLAIVRGLQQAPVPCGVTVAAFFATAAAPGLRRIPPVLTALVAGVSMVTALGQADWSALTLRLARPQIVAPAFSPAAALELVIPLVLMVIAVQNVQGLAALWAAGYRPPVRGLTVAVGLGSLVSAVAGGHSACIAGPSTAIVSGPAAGPPPRRDAASVVLGLVWIATGLVAPAATSITRVVPRPLVDVLAGLALLPPMAQFFRHAFGGRFPLGALAAFLVTTSGLVLFRIAAPFWGLVAGAAVSLAVEREDFSEVNDAQDATRPRPGGATGTDRRVRPGSGR
jgi:benzoate membrane transport protein